VTLLRECGEPGCSILTLGERCVEHEGSARRSTYRSRAAAAVRLHVPDHRYQLLASVASGLTAVVAIRVLRHLTPLGH